MGQWLCRLHNCIDVSADCMLVVCQQESSYFTRTQGYEQRAHCHAQDEQAAMLASRPAARRLSVAIYGAEAARRARSARLANPSPTRKCNPNNERPWRRSSSAGCVPASARGASAQTAGLGGGSERGAPPDAGTAALGRARGLGGPAACAGRPRRHSLPKGSAKPTPAWGVGRGAQAAAPARCASADARRPGRGVRSAPPQTLGIPSPGVPGLRMRLKGSAADAAQWLRAVGRGGPVGGSPGVGAREDGRRPGSGRSGGGALGASGAGADLEERFAGFLARQQACQQACCPGSWLRGSNLCYMGVPHYAPPAALPRCKAGISKPADPASTCCSQWQRPMPYFAAFSQAF